MTERFNVAGALLVKLFGRPAVEDEEYAVRAASVRDIGVRIAVNRSVFFVALTLVASLATAMVYGVGGVMAVNGTLTVGTLLALTALLARLYGPLTAHLQRAGRHHDRARLLRAGLRGARPRAARRRGARRPAGARPARCGSRSTTSASPTPRPTRCRWPRSRAPPPATAGAAARCCTTSSFTVEPGHPRGPRRAERGRQDDHHLARRAALRPHVRRGPHQRRRPARRHQRVAARRRRRRHPGRPPLPRHDPRQPRLRRARRPPRTTWWRRCGPRRSGRSSTRCPPGLDTVVGDRGHRLSGGEKQRLAIARLLLKGPGLIVLDEATAHLDSESEQALQRALDEALRDRSALVIAHRLSHGAARRPDPRRRRAAASSSAAPTHELWPPAGSTAELYRTQFDDELGEVLEPRA